MANSALITISAWRGDIRQPSSSSRTVDGKRGIAPRRAALSLPQHSFSYCLPSCLPRICCALACYNTHLIAPLLTTGGRCLPPPRPDPTFPHLPTTHTYPPPQPASHHTCSHTHTHPTPSIHHTHAHHPHTLHSPPTPPPPAHTPTLRWILGQSDRLPRLLCGWWGRTVLVAKATIYSFFMLMMIYGQLTVEEYIQTCLLYKLSFSIAYERAGILTRATPDQTINLMGWWWRSGVGVTARRNRRLRRTV